MPTSTLFPTSKNKTRTPFFFCKCQENAAECQINSLIQPLYSPRVASEAPLPSVCTLGSFYTILLFFLSSLFLFELICV